MTTERQVEETGKSGPEVAVVIAAAVAVLVAVRWLARLDWPVLAGIAAGVVAVLFACGRCGRSGGCRGTGCGTCGCGRGCGCIPAPGTRRCSSCGCGGERRGGPPGPAGTAVADLAGAAVPPVADLGPGRPRPLPARAAGPDRGARHLHRPAP